MTRPRLLDLFSGAGGCSVGYHRAGFDVTGVDLHPMPRYPFEFVQADAMDVLADRDFLAGFDAIHASPPCQAFSAMSVMPNARQHEDLLTPTRARLQEVGLPYVIENVPGSPIDVRPPDLFGEGGGIVLCGSMFDLHTDEYELRRHLRCREVGAGRRAHGYQLDGLERSQSGDTPAVHAAHRLPADRPAGRRA